MAIDDWYFKSVLRERILEVLLKSPLSFTDIVAECEGAYPTIVRDVLAELCDNNKICISNSRYYRTDWAYSDVDYGYSLKFENEADGIIKSDPHPSEYDWRFSPNTVSKFLCDSHKYLNSDSKVALFGTTSFFEGFNNGGYETTLFNKSHFLISEFKANGFVKGLVVHDLFESLEEYTNRFDIVIADPPWYIEFYYAFMIRSAQVLKNNGILVLSVFPELTRPLAIQEREDIFSYAYKLGFEMYEEKKKYFVYSTPKFESFSLSEEGVYLDGNWRSGDLVVLKKINESSLDITEKIQVDDEHEWNEYLFKDGKRLRLKKRNENNMRDFKFMPVDDNKILKSVSRRSFLRSKIDLWTSENAAYSIEGMELLKEALKLKEDGNTIVAIINLLKSKYPHQKGLENLEKLLKEL